MSGIVVSPFLRGLLHRLNTVTDDHSASNLDVPRVLARLVNTLQDVAVIIDDAEERGTGSASVMDWMRRLQEELFEVDDLIDEVQVQFQLHPPRGVRSFFCGLNPFSKESVLVQALEQSLCVLNMIEEDGRRFGFKSCGNLTSVSRGSTPHPYARRSEIVGRESDKTEIIDSILNPVAESGSSTVVVAIVGMGGIGKTSLAQLIFNDPTIRSNSDIMLWVDAGEKEDDVYNSFYQMCMQLPAMEENYLNLEHMRLEEMKMAVYKLLSNKRFLLVVDDSWCEDFHGNAFREVTDFGSKGSAIIVTTRSLPVARAFRASVIHCLDGLAEDVAYQLFTEYAFASNGTGTQLEFDLIAKQIAMRCRGHPILLKMFGTYLYSKDNMQQWKEVLSIDQQQGAGFDDRILQFLKFLSDKLPSHLKLPFCTLFLQKVSVEELICLWMALGFLCSDDPNQQPEYIGRKYLQELAESALCSDVEYAPGGVVRSIKMHDIVQDLAKMKAFEEGFLVGNRSFQHVDKTTRYLILNEDSELILGVLDAKKLRFLMVSTGEQDSARILGDIVSGGFKCLRVLVLGRCDVDMLPDSIGQLSHLRYLDVGRNAVLKKLPDSICNLWHLQTLLLHGCYRLQEIPLDIGRLQNLRYLTLRTQQESLPEAIGQLSSLRTLGFSHCPRLASLPCSIQNLKNLQTLAIVDCQEMDLMASSSVEGLKGIDGIDTLLLAGLPNFERLPPDMGTPSVVMKHLLIQDCKKMTETEWINQFRFLHSLTIEWCPQLAGLTLTDAASGINNLGELVIRNCPGLEDTTWVRQFVSLRSLIIEDCPNLMALDAGFSELKKLERLEIRRCPRLTERCASPAGEDWSLVSHVQKIELD